MAKIAVQESDTMLIIDLQLIHDLRRSDEYALLRGSMQAGTDHNLKIPKIAYNSDRREGH